MKGLEKFQKAMLKAAHKNYMPVIEKHHDELAETLKNDIFKLDGPRQIARTATSREESFGKAFRGFLEISKSLETLDDIEFYINRFPFQGTRISRERYLQFHVESYLSEVYVLQERLTKYSKMLGRQYRKDPRLPNVQQQCETLSEYISKPLQSVVRVRGRHVHEVRFNDADIDRLGTIGLLAQSSEDEIATLLKDYYREEHRNVKKMWKDRIKANNKAIEELIDQLFEALYSIVFDEKTAEFRYPNTK